MAYIIKLTLSPKEMSQSFPEKEDLAGENNEANDVRRQKKKNKYREKVYRSNV